MKIAVCFRGEIRTGVEAANNVLNFIDDLLPDCDFFIHTWDDSDHRGLAKQSHHDLKNKNMWSDHNEKLEKVKQIYNPKLIKVENFKTIEQQIIDRYGHLHKNYLNQVFIWRFYSWRESVKLKQQYEIENSFKYDHVVILRFDAIYGADIKLSQLLTKVPTNGFGVNGIHKDIPDDMFFISSSSVMDKVSQWQEHRYYHAQIEDYLYNPNWNKLHAPFYYYILSQGYNIIDLRLEYFCVDVAVLRKECLQYNPIDEFNKCRACDKLNYHAVDMADPHFDLLSQEEVLRDARLTMKSREYLPPAFNHLKDKL